MIFLLNGVDRLSAIAAVLARILILGLGLAMFYEVVARYGFNAPTIWSHDVSYMLNGAIFMLGAGYTLMVNQHVRIDFLSRLMPIRLQHLINLLVLACLFLPAMSWVAIRACRDAWQAFTTNEVEVVSPWAPLIWPFESALALGLVVLCLQALAQVVRHGIGVRHPELVPRPSPDPHEEIAQ